MHTHSPPFKARKAKETYIPPPEPIPFRNRRRNNRHRRAKTSSHRQKATDSHDKSPVLLPEHHETPQSIQRLHRSSIHSSPASSQEPSCPSGTSYSIIDHDIQYARPAIIRRVLDERMDVILESASKEFLERAAKIVEETARISRLSLEAQTAQGEVCNDGHGSISDSATSTEHSNQDYASTTIDLEGVSNHQVSHADRASTETPSNQILDEQDAHRDDSQTIKMAGSKKNVITSTLALPPDIHPIEPRNVTEDSIETRDRAKSGITKLDEELTKSQEQMEKEIKALENRNEFSPKKLQSKIRLAKERKYSRDSRLRKKFKGSKNGQKDLTSPVIEASSISYNQPKVSITDSHDAVLPVKRPVTPIFAPEEEVEFVSPIRSFKDFEEDFENNASGSEPSYSNETFKSTLDSIDMKSLLRPAYAKCVKDDSANQIKVLVPSCENNADYEECEVPGSFPTPPSSQLSEDDKIVALTRPADVLPTTKTYDGFQSSTSVTAKKLNSRLTKRKTSTSSSELSEPSGSEFHQKPEIAAADRLNHQQKPIQHLVSILSTPKADRFIHNAKNEGVADTSSSGSGSDSSLPSLENVLSQTSSHVASKSPIKLYSNTSIAAPSIIDLTSPSTPKTKLSSDFHRPSKKQRFSNSIEVINGTEISPPIMRKSPTPFLPRESSSVSSSADFLKRKSPLLHKPINLETDSDTDEGDGFMSHPDLSFEAFDEGSPSPNRKPRDRTKGKDVKKSQVKEENDKTSESVKTKGKEISKRSEEQGGKVIEGENNKGHEGRKRKRAKTAPPKISEVKQKKPTTSIPSSKFTSAPPTTDDIQAVPVAAVSLSKPSTGFSKPFSSRTLIPPTRLTSQTTHTPTKPPTPFQPVKHNLQPTFHGASTASSFSPYRSPRPYSHPSNKQRKTTYHARPHPYANHYSSPNAQRNFTAINQLPLNTPKSSYDRSSSPPKSPQTPRKHIKFNDNGLPIQANGGAEQMGIGKSQAEKLKRREMEGLPMVNSPTPLRGLVKREYYGRGSGREG